MINIIEIQNFKSIRSLNLECKRVNIFIGEPNTGKSNILEALGLLSWCSHGHFIGRPLKEFIRLQQGYNIFYDNLLDHPLEIKANSDASHGIVIKGKYENGSIIFKGTIINPEIRSDVNIQFSQIDMNGDSLIGGGGPISIKNGLEYLKFYRFSKVQLYDNQFGSYLLPPSGDNLFTLVMGNKKLRETMKSFFDDYGLKLILKPVERVFVVQKQTGDLGFDFPYSLISDTLQRMIFYTIAIESNQNSTLVFEEPESQAFPYYTKYLGERIGRDSSNQYFIATHNPYLLSAILEKTPKHDVSVFVTYYQNYETKAISLKENQISEIMSFDPFFNLTEFIPEDKDDHN